MRNEFVLWHARCAASLFAVALATCATVARADDGTPAAPPVSAAPTQAVAAPQLTVPDSPIVVFQLASSAADVVAAQQVTALAAERLRYMYGDQVKVVTDMGTETMQQIVERLGAGIYIGGSIEKINGQYYADFQARDGITNAIVGEQRFAFQDMSALPKDTALVSLVESGPLVPNAHYVLVPLIDDTQVAQENQSAYLTWTQQDLVKHLAAHGITATLVSAMDPVDARIGAADLCRDNNATGVIVGHTWHRQDYQQGALKSGMKGFEKALEIVPLAGPIAAGLVNAAGNGAIGVAGSDDKYPAHAEVDLTLLNCDGKRVWSGAGQGDTAHFSGHNVAAGQIGAIDLAVTTISDTIATHR